MYKELTIENIKTFEKEQKLKIAPMTLIYGENSSGKTTLLKTFDIVHNIFSEGEVKRGKSVSQKDSPFYRNENIQNISAKKIHYFSSKLNKKKLKIQIDLDLPYENYTNRGELEEYFTNISQKENYVQVYPKGFGFNPGGYIAYSLSDKDLNTRRKKVLSVPIKILLTIKYLKKKKISKVESIEIKRSDNKSIVTFSRINKNYKTIVDPAAVGFMAERFRRIINRPDRYNPLYHRGRPIAEPDYFVDEKFYADYQIITKEDFVWKPYYKSYKKIFSQNKNTKFRREAMKLLFESIYRLYYSPKNLAKRILNIKKATQNDIETFGAATFKYYIYFIIQLILKEEDENSFDLDSISKKINIYEEKISYKNFRREIEISYQKDKRINQERGAFYANEMLSFKKGKVRYKTEKERSVLFRKKNQEKDYNFSSKLLFADIICDAFHTNLLTLRNLLNGKKEVTFTNFCKRANSDLKDLFNIRFTKRDANLSWNIIRESSGYSSSSTFGVLRYMTEYIDKGVNNIFYEGKDLFNIKSPELLPNPTIDLLRRSISEIKKTVDNLVICHPNKTDVSWSVPNEADYPSDFFERIEEIAKKGKKEKINKILSEQDEKVRSEFLKRKLKKADEKKVMDAHRISASGANFDRVLANNTTLRKDLNKVLKDILNLELVVVTPKFLKKIIKDRELYKAYRNAQRRGIMYPTGRGMYSKNKFIMLRDLSFKKSFYIHGEEVGKGPTNILPFLAQILSNRPNLTYLVQELENNWHPKYQSKIIELIAKVIKKSPNKNFILETHSELFILTVQKLVQKGLLKPEEVSINYISRSRIGNSEIINIPLNSQGGFEKAWPGGFFNERIEVLSS